MDYQFTRYLEVDTGNYLAEYVGICNHANSCGYHFPPGKYFQTYSNSTGTDLKQQLKARNYLQFKKKSNNNPDYIEPSHMNNTLINYTENKLFQFLKTIIDTATLEKIARQYRLGTCNHFGVGTTIFWQIDITGRIRTGKMIKYDPQTGQRVKKPFPLTNWVHSVHYSKTFNLCQCLFGEHLLNKDPLLPVALVESEKTAIIAKALIPDYLWLATGGLKEFKQSKLEVLKGRRVVAYPDLGAYNYWLKCLTKLNIHITISDFLEKNSSKEQHDKGMDVADFLLGG